MSGAGRDKFKQDKSTIFQQHQRALLLCTYTYTHIYIYICIYGCVECTHLQVPERDTNRISMDSMLAIVYLSVRVAHSVTPRSSSIALILR
jgi:hypothetical protein